MRSLNPSPAPRANLIVRTRILACLPLFLAGVLRAESSESDREAGLDKILFVDRTFLEQDKDVRLKVHPPRKTNERQLESEFAWEGATLNWFSVLKDGEKYRMWYECYDVEGWPTPDDTSFCYAESDDGIHWVKPKLGLFTYRGSKENNILFRQVGRDQHRSRVHGSCVFIDPTAVAEERYKCVSQGQFQGIGDRPYYVAGMTSPDGLHWKRLERPICLVFADSQYSGFWDAVQRRYMLFGRVAGRGGRAIGRSTSDRFESFAPLTEARVLQAEVEDPPECDLYNPACQTYPGAEGLYVMFPSFFRHRDDTLEIRLAVSRDGANWTWPEREASFIPLGPADAFDGGSLYMANGGCLPTGDEFSFYFSGSALKHAEVDFPKLNDPKNRRVITRAVARRDRLISVTAPASGGSFQTPPLRMGGKSLVANVAVRTGGELRIGLLDERGNPIRGRGLADCRPVMKDATQCDLVWTSGDDISEWNGQRIRLQVALRDADLFGLEFQDDRRP